MFDGLRSDASDFESLRKDAADLSGFDEVLEFFPEEEKPTAVRRGRRGRFLGMTAPQRFLLAVMLMIAVCSLGAACLLITGKFAF